MSQNGLVGEIEQTIATLRGEADELRSRSFLAGTSDVAQQLEHRANELKAALGEDPEQAGRGRYPHVDIHLCKSCGDAFEPGDEVVSLSDGHVDENERYDVSNRRFWHRDCFPGVSDA